jgi:hypothetical protein
MITDLLVLKDMLYHVLGGVLLIVGGSLMITSVFKYRKDYCEPYPWGDRSDCQPKYQEKLAGGVTRYQNVESIFCELLLTDMFLTFTLVLCYHKRSSLFGHCRIGRRCPKE